VGNPKANVLDSDEYREAIKQEWNALVKLFNNDILKAQNYLIAKFPDFDPQIMYGSEKL
jgi:hypothetical protein